MPHGRTALLRTLQALAAGAAAFGMLAAVAPIARTCFGMGVMYAAMSEDPMALHGEHPHRLLGPLLANAVGLGGERYWIFSHVANVLFLAAAFAGARQLGARLADAALVTLALAFSGGFGIYVGWLAGFPDALTFALLIAAAAAARNGALCWTLHLLNAANHEQALLFTPLLLWVRWRAARPRPVRELAALAALLAAYVGFRFVVAAYAPAEKLTLEYYAATHHFPVGFAGLVPLAACASVVLYGPLLLLPLWSAWQRPLGADNRAAAIVVLTLAAMLAVAYDFWRFVNVLSLPIGVAAVRFLQRGGRRVAFVLLGASAWLLARLAVPFVFPRFEAAMRACDVYLDPNRFGTCMVGRTQAELLAAGTVLLAFVVLSRPLARRLPVGEAPA